MIRTGVGFEVTGARISMSEICPKRCPVDRRGHHLFEVPATLAFVPRRSGNAFFTSPERAGRPEAEWLESQRRQACMSYRLLE